MTADDFWLPFTDMLSPDELPVFGLRILLRIGQDGIQHVDYKWQGDDVYNYTVVGALEAVKMEFFHGQLHAALEGKGGGEEEETT